VDLQPGENGLSDSAKFSDGGVYDASAADGAVRMILATGSDQEGCREARAIEAGEVSGMSVNSVYLDLRRLPRKLIVWADDSAA
jgi:hypothetical protein